MKNLRINSEPRKCTINSRKFDGSIRRSWRANLIEETAAELSFIGIFENEVNHPILGIIRRGTVSYEFYWKNRGYNIFRFHNPEGDLRNFYCNINLPPIFKDDVLDYVDLDVDVIVWQDFSYEILDWDEFEENTVKFSYPPEIRFQVERNLAEIICLIKKKSFPFDYAV